ncbi:MAG: O-antigen ligase family protein [Gammaproteobacteria bacterium]|nr:O-antigen ligase family protein [Gammaproteobacteria bacterium]
MLGVLSVSLLGGLGFAVRGGLLNNFTDTLRSDLGVPLKRSIQAMDSLPDAPLTWLIGAGKGAYPRARLWHDVDANIAPSTFQYTFDIDGNAFLRMGRAGGNERPGLAIRQRLDIDAAGQTLLRLRARTPNSESGRLMLEICERNLLAALGECRQIGIETVANQNAWQEYEKPVDLSGLGRLHWWGSRPVDIAILNRGLGDTIDVDDIQLLDASGAGLIANPGFEDDMDHWLHAFDDHSALHIDNLFIDAWFEGGLLGVIALSILIVVVFRQLLRRLIAGDSFAMPLAAAFSGILLVGLFGNVFDDPRITLLFFLLVWAALLPAEPALAASTIMPRTDNAGYLMRALAGFRAQPLWMRIGAVFAVLAVGGVVAAVNVARRHDLDRTQVILHFAQMVGLKPEGFIGAMLPEPKYPDHQFDGRTRPLHPRILLTDLFDWDGRSVPAVITQRRALWKEQGHPIYDPCTSSDLVGKVTCWLGDGTEKRGNFLLGNALNLQIQPPSAGGNQYGNAWELAIAADFLDREPGYTAEHRATIQQRLIKALNDHLILLDGNSLSAWHGRLTMASNAWLIAIAIDADLHWKEDMVRRAQAHFVEAARAVAFVEAWPEGFNYWINSRAYTFALAAAAYINGLEDARNSEWIRATLERIGLWMIYATRPDNRAGEVADEGPRVDLKDETRRVIDIIAGVTRNRVFANYSLYLQKLHRAESYYRGYRATFQLLNDPTVEAYADVKRWELEGLKQHLPTTELFGRDAFNLAYIRSGWGPDDTFISFRAGASLAHHGHYDAGHFTIFKGAPLALTSGTYGDFFAYHRLNYSIRTVAKNSLLILRPGEIVKPHPRFEPNVADGGQRLVMPTGSAITSVDDFKANLHQGRHYEGGRILGFSHAAGEHSFISTDLTDAYNSSQYDEMGTGGKVRKVTRELLYLDAEDRVLIHDQVSSTDPGFTKKWLLHTANKPLVSDARVLVGNADNGILETRASFAVVENGRGRMDVQRLYPEDATLRLIGGEDYRFYVETDGDDSTLDGANIAQGVNPAKWHDIGGWRIEIQPGAPRVDDEFLVALSPRLNAEASNPLLNLPSGDAGVRAVATDTAVVVYVNSDSGGGIRLSVPPGRQKLYVAGLGDGRELRVNGLPYVVEPGTRLVTAVLPDEPEIELGW